MDNYSRKCMAIQVGQSLKGSDVVEVMERVRLANQAVPQRIQVDNGRHAMEANSFQRH